MRSAGPKTPVTAEYNLDVWTLDELLGHEFHPLLILVMTLCNKVKESVRTRSRICGQTSAVPQQAGILVSDRLVRVV